MERIIFDIETDGLNPIENRITAIGVKTEDKELVFMDKNEAKILTDFWNFLRTFENFRLIGFNNFQFDNYFVNIRCFKHDIRIIDVRNRIIDLRSILAFGGKFKNGTLDDYGGLLKMSKFKGMSGSLIAEAWKHEKFQTIEKYLRQDLKLTFAIYNRCKKIGLL